MSDELGFNKIAGAILATALTFIGIKEIAHAAYHPHMPEVPAYGADILAAAEAAAKAGAVEEVILPFPQPEWIAKMDYDAGATQVTKCLACHTFTKGGANTTGPNLWGIVGKAAAQDASFAYSSAMKEAGITWDFETLNNYLEKPQRYVKGTNMAFAGLKRPEQRAAMIEYLRMSADNPLPRPEAAPMPEPALEGVEGLEGVEVAQDGAVIETVIAEETLQEIIVDAAEDAQANDEAQAHEH